MSPTFQIASKNDLVNIDYIFSYSSHKTGFDISCKLYPLETICMKCQNLFSGPKKKKENYFKILSVEIFTQSA